MTVKVTLEYSSIDQAIAALALLAPQGTKTAAAAVAAGVTERPANSRKGRSDKGQPRGPHKVVGETNAGGTAPPSLDGGNKETTDAGKAADEAANPTSTISGPSAVPAAPNTDAPEGSTTLPPDQRQDVVSGASVPSVKDAQDALSALYDKKGATVALATLTRFGVNRVTNLPEGKRAEFIEAARKAAE